MRGGGEILRTREGERERDPEREREEKKGGGGRQPWGERGGGGDVDVERKVKKVNPELECERNVGNGGVFLWLVGEKERKRVGGGRGGVRDLGDLRALQSTPLIHSLLHFHSSRHSKDPDVLSDFFTRHSDLLQILIRLMVFLFSSRLIHSSITHRQHVAYFSIWTLFKSTTNVSSLACLYFRLHGLFKAYCQSESCR